MSHRFSPSILPRSKPLSQILPRKYQSNQHHHNYLPTRRHSTSTTQPSRFNPLGSTLALPSGRTLGYHTSGPPTGIPVLYIHGNPDSGIQVTGALETRIAEKLGIRWIGPDRPGVGLSTFYDEKEEGKGREVLSYPQDVQCLVEYLRLREYYVLGTSGGTGYALACARDLPSSTETSTSTSGRLKGVGICAGMGPISCGFSSMGPVIKNAWELWRQYPAEMEDYINSEYTSLSQDPDSTKLRARLEADFRSWLTGKDLEHMMREEMLEAAVRGYRQIYAQGARAHAKGIEVNLRDWGINIEDIEFEGIRFWYGDEDVNTTPVMGKFMAERLRGSKYREFRGKSHFTIWDEERLEDMLRDLIGVGS